MRNNPMSSKWMVGAVVLVALIGQACSSGRQVGRSGAASQQPSAAAKAGPPTPIDGMYSSATSILTLKDGDWSRSLPPMNGTFTVSGDRLSLSGQAGCPGEGTYTWALANDVMTLTKVTDACQERDLQFVSIEKWHVVHHWGESIRSGQTLLLGDGRHVATFNGKEVATGKSSLQIDASLNPIGYVFSPTVVIGSPGQTIEVTLINPRGRDTENLQHNFKIDQLGISVEIPYGTSTTVSVTLPASGSLRFYCSYHARFDQQGEFLVGG